MNLYGLPVNLRVDLQVTALPKSGSHRVITGLDLAGVRLYFNPLSFRGVVAAPQQVRPESQIFIFIFRLSFFKFQVLIFEMQ